MSKVTCASCRHDIDASAKVCPYCGADPNTGQKAVDTSALLQEMFKPRRISAGESVLEYARHRQGVVIAISGAILFLILAGLHQFNGAWKGDGAKESGDVVTQYGGGASR